MSERERKRAEIVARAKELLPLMREGQRWSYEQGHLHDVARFKEAIAATEALIAEWDRA